MRRRRRSCLALLGPLAATIVARVDRKGEPDDGFTCPFTNDRIIQALAADRARRESREVITVMS